MSHVKHMLCGPNHILFGLTEIKNEETGGTLLLNIQTLCIITS